MARKLPPWLQRTEAEIRQLNLNTRRGLKYWTARLTATGPWTDARRIRAVYREKDRRNARGGDYVVDHIVPLCSPWVCGLECHWNLQIITWRENARKSNTWWPQGPMDEPFVQGDFFTDPVSRQDFLVPVSWI